eukprot:scaffold22398_cov102-Isochrysis_galbana.AAC.4
MHCSTRRRKSAVPIRSQLGAERKRSLTSSANVVPNASAAPSPLEKSYRRACISKKSSSAAFSACCCAAARRSAASDGAAPPAAPPVPPPTLGSGWRSIVLSEVSTCCDDCRADPADRPASLAPTMVWRCTEPGLGREPNLACPSLVGRAGSGAPTTNLDKSSHAVLFQGSRNACTRCVGCGVKGLESPPPSPCVVWVKLDATPASTGKGRSPRRASRSSAATPPQRNSKRSSTPLALARRKAA